MSDIAQEYRVLARKYRPKTFSDLIGQETLVRILTNAIERNRVPHAFILTGIRGVGKTTTARIIARGLNCTGTDGNGGPTVSPCGVCPNCVDILGDHHVDILEMDAASRTGVGDIREIIETVRYKPASARYKIYIIDEVHMLSNSAFNALLKTLEEPPAHVKFIFATTEIRKIPVTILSRCMRFDLSRIDTATLAQHLTNICGKEQVRAEPEALALIANAAEGSVRDSLSILDQAIAHGGGDVTSELVQDMLGLSQESALYDLLAPLLSGDVKQALAQLKSMYLAGSDPAVILQDMLDAIHFLTQMKITPEIASDPSYPEVRRKRAGELAAQLTIPVLTRLWQMALKGLNEVRQAPNSLAAAEMILIRIAHAADMPPPAMLVEQAGKASGGAAPSPAGAPSGGGARQPQPAMASAPYPGGSPATMAAPKLQEPVAQAQSSIRLESFAEVLALFKEHREIMLYTWLWQEVRPISFSHGRIEINVPDHTENATRIRDITRHLQDWTGERWTWIVSTRPGGPTEAEKAAEAEARRIEEAKAHPLVSAVLTEFPGAKIVRVIPREEETS